MDSNKEHIIVGMSGGVDSSVAALLLKERDYEVSGLFMKNWEEEDTGHCTAAEDAIDALGVCEQLNIPLDAVNFSKEYWDNVFSYFLEEYKSGRTPNPDILCNKEIKFKAFLDYALKQGAERIATGHYARITNKDGNYQLLKGLDPEKDQSYFLFRLNQYQLSKAIFPVGELNKKEVRELAFKSGFANHAKKDSTGICFIGEMAFKEFLNQYLPAKPGEIRSVDNTVLGEHDGLMFHTIGQRKGLGIGGIHGNTGKNSGEPWYVVDKNLDDNSLVVAQGKNHPLLFKDALVCSQIHWISDTPPKFPLQCTAKIRYRQQDQDCKIHQQDKDNYHVKFYHPQRAVTPGQSIVFYHDEICIGGGIIESAIRHEQNYKANMQLQK